MEALGAVCGAERVLFNQRKYSLSNNYIVEVGGDMAALGGGGVPLKQLLSPGELC